MSDTQKNTAVLWVGGLIISALIASLAAVYSQSGKTSQANQQNLIDNLPAVLAQLDVLKAEVRALQSDTLSSGEIEARFAALVERLNGLEGQLSRRFDEVVKQPMDITRNDVDDLEKRTDTIAERIAALEALAK